MFRLTLSVNSDRGPYVLQQACFRPRPHAKLHEVESRKPGPRIAHDRAPKPISLKELAARLQLSPTSLSLVLNGSPAAGTIPKATQDLIFEAARRYNYRPNFLARSLRVRRTFAIGILVPELSEGYSSLVISGVEDLLSSKGYIYLATTHRHQPTLIASGLTTLWERGVEGVIALDTPLHQVPQWLKTVSVSGHEQITGVTNVVLNHDTAADLALRHLVDLGHRDIAVIKGQSFSSDSEPRLQAILCKASELGLAIPSRRVVALEGNSPSPETGYVAASKLLETGRPFTAIFCFNDISAMGAMRAFQDAGLRVPADVSVVGFDDITGAAYHTPSLTTIRQPLRRMGAIAAETLLGHIASEAESPLDLIKVEPELIVRESTGPPPRK
jgi:LacI family transcriptional regulator